MNQSHTQARQETGTEPSESTLGRDALFSLLGNRRRRWAIRYLTANGRTQLSELAEQIAAWEAGVPPEEISAKQRKYAYTSLQQRHLPALDDAGVIEFCPVEGVIEVTDQLDSLDIYLEVVPSNTIPWSIYYLGIGLAGCVVMSAIAMIDSWPVTALSVHEWAILFSLTVTISAIVHTYRTRSMRLGSHELPPEVTHDP
ncbi:DUF7344 domain-containing protein [Halocatena halophila]|uniref:DUF7344 domain-containing protein n=1 Tax=Halocatena halophila TaxID=2814576 RepID=UPI002ED18272